MRRVDSGSPTHFSARTKSSKVEMFGVREGIAVNAGGGQDWEGGGQVVRLVLSLAWVDSRPVHLHSIRASRPKPGLQAQHLGGAQLTQQLAGYCLTGAKLDSKDLTLDIDEDAPVTPLTVTENVAQGAVTLLLQASLPALMFCAPATEMVLMGGTDNPFVPPVAHVALVLRPLLLRFGAQMDVTVPRHGFFPSGCGELRVQARLQEGRTKLQAVTMLERGDFVQMHVQIVSSSQVSYSTHLRNELERKLKTIPQLAAVPMNVMVEGKYDVIEPAVEAQCSVQVAVTTSTGCVLSVNGLCACHESSAAQQRGKGFVLENAILGATTSLAGQVAKDLKALINCGACVDEFTADQLIAYIALAEGTSRILIPPMSEFTSQHLPTAIAMTSLLTGAVFRCTLAKGGCQIIECDGIGASGTHIERL